MLKNAVLSDDSKILTVTIPFDFRKRAGRKMIIVPEGAETPWAPPPTPRSDAALVKALARAHRWKKLIDSGRFSSIRELADSERMTDTYVGNLLRLTLLAPDIVEAILDGRLPKGIGLAHFMKPWPAVWAEQRRHLQALAQG